jgi:hypothetical protein
MCRIIDEERPFCCFICKVESVIFFSCWLVFNYTLSICIQIINFVFSLSLAVKSTVMYTHQHANGENRNPATEPPGVSDFISNFTYGWLAILSFADLFFYLLIDFWRRLFYKEMKTRSACIWQWHIVIGFCNKSQVR